MNGVNSRCKFFFLPLSPALPRPQDQRIHHGMNHFLLADPGKGLAVGNQERRDPVDPRPKGLAGQFDVDVAEFSGSYAVGNVTAQEIERLEARCVGLGALSRDKLFRHRHHERRSVMMRVFEAKTNVCHQAVFKAFHRITRLFLNTRQHFRQPSKRFLANLLEKIGLVPEMQVDRGRRVFDLFGDAPHGNVFVPFADEEFAGRVQDLLAEKFLLPGSTLLDPHESTSKYLTMLSYCRCIVNSYWIKSGRAYFTRCTRAEWFTAMACISKCPPRSSAATPTNSRVGRSLE